MNSEPTNSAHFAKQWRYNRAILLTKKSRAPNKKYQKQGGCILEALNTTQ